MKTLKPFMFVLSALFLAGCDQSGSQETESQFNDRVADTLYCFSTAESMAQGIDESYAKDARQLQETYLSMSAEKLCKPEQVDRFTCITMAFYDDKDPDKVCLRPYEWDDDAFVICATDVQEFINKNLLPTIDTKSKELETQFNDSTLDETAFLKKHYADNCKDML